MKKLRFLTLFLLAFLLSGSFVYAQKQDTTKFNLNIQLGASTRLGMPMDIWSVIPQLGLDINSGLFGFRATIQYFETYPEFDIESYIAPIGSYISQSGTKMHSNLLFGFNPYLNLPQQRFTVQPSLAFNYLLQNGASYTADYEDLGTGSVMDASVGSLLRDVYIISPNVRVLFGLKKIPMLFYAELGYSLVANIQEYKISSRDLDGVVLSSGNIDRAALVAANINYTKEDIMHSGITFGVGIEFNIAGGPRQVTAPATRLFADYSEYTFYKEKVDLPEGYCCDNIVVHEPVAVDGNCCYAINYDLSVTDDCVLDKVIFNALNGQQISVNYDLFGGTDSSCVSQYIINKSASILPFGSNHFLAEICACRATKADMEVEVEIVFYSSDNIVCRDTVTLECYQEPIQCDCKSQGIWLEGKYFPNNAILDFKKGDTKHFEFSGFCYPQDTCESNHWWTITYPDGSISEKDYIWNENVTFNQVGTYKLSACIECKGSLETCCETIIVNIEE